MSLVPDAGASRTALRGLVGDGLSDDEARTAYAAATWSTLVEPGDGTAGALIARYGAAEALERVVGEGTTGLAGGAGVTEEDVRAARARWLPRHGDLDRVLAAARRAGARLLVPGEEVWPRALDDLGVHAPVCLWARGDVRALSSSATLALVGARAATAYGTHVVTELAADSAARGVVVVSGAAYGIDGSAHRGALRADGTTVAVLAGGVDRPYPAGHDELIAAIAQTGLVLAEVPCGTAPTKWRFLARNRVIAALAGATIVVEAAHRSGALNTAHHAAALGRALGAVPGPVTSAASAGCHRLLREADAVCVTSAADAWELLGISGDAAGEPDAGDGGRTDERTRVLDALSGRRARATTEVARLSGLSVAEASGILALLELDGRVERSGDGWRRRSEPRPARLW
ncbi:DNA protecting protein DprA [Microbacterium sp. oral taxon 186 str. F0373]|jgi:DNA processing protein|uniref:DNA-processing protein DprA n=1 Tax=Microbacterium sp. oral taxon 186 TaxID=712383 RepID=UPI00025876A3|nr:DNA-processing protein DprA [Microbacterium sp. oral taxon 186]EIC08213.1 DNA protecting protein DprA [Microbacterium laevaniformans OR221]EPD83109.1 DNA protecting protein DprA [Microbacterium sp. oral taxon 186 str. F0373]